MSSGSGLVLSGYKSPKYVPQFSITDNAEKTQNKTTVVFLVQNIGCLKLHPEMVQADHKPK